MEKTINDWLINNGWGDFANVASFPLSILTVILTAWISYILMRRVVFPIIMKIVEKSPTKWDDDILTPSMVNAICQLLPALIVAWLLPKVFIVNEKLSSGSPSSPSSILSGLVCMSSTGLSTHFSTQWTNVTEEESIR